MIPDHMAVADIVLLNSLIKKLEMLGIASPLGIYQDAIDTLRDRDGSDSRFDQERDKAIEYLAGVRDKAQKRRVQSVE